MKILIISGSYPPMRCGVGDYVENLAAALSKHQGVRVEVLTSGNSATAEVRGDVVIWRLMRDWSLKRWRVVARVIRAIRPDYVHIQYPTQGYSSGWLPPALPLLAWLMGSKVIQTWHEGCRIRQPISAILKGVVPSPLVVVRPNFQKMNLHPLLRTIFAAKRFEFIPNASAVPRAGLAEADRLFLRQSLLDGQQRLIVFFGFLLPNKGAELVFDVADPTTDRVVIAGEVGDEKCKGRITSRTEEAAWKGKAKVMGYMQRDAVAALLSAADAVVLPFRNGGGEWNTSIHAAVLQGTFVLTTSHTQRGYSADRNIFFAKIDDVVEMRRELSIYAGRRGTGESASSWEKIALEHLNLYLNV